MHFLTDALILLAKSSTASTPDAKGYSMSWAVVLIGLIVGLFATLSPTKRTTEIKKGKEG